MENIDVITGVKIKPDSLISKVSKKKKKDVHCRYIKTLYSRCWIFNFGIQINSSKNNGRLVYYLSGFDELNELAGIVECLPETDRIAVFPSDLIDKDLNNKKIKELSWEANKSWIIKKYRALYKAPELKSVETSIVYKAIYIYEISNSKTGEIIYKSIDSLNGNLQDVKVS